MSSQGERSRDGEPGTPGVPVSVELFYFHWVAAKIMRSVEQRHCGLNCVCGHKCPLKGIRGKDKFLNTKSTPKYDNKCFLLH